MKEIKYKVALDGYVQYYLITIPEGGGEAVAVLFPGGKGLLNLHKERSEWNEANFLVRSRKYFIENNIATVIIDNKLIDGEYEKVDYRYKPKFDIRNVMSVIRNIFRPTPMWFIGTSRGSSYALSNIRRYDFIEGLVLLSSLIENNDKTMSCLGYDIESIRIPTLIGVHENDTCKVTYVKGNKKLYDRLNDGITKEFKLFKGGDYDEDNYSPCSNQSHHGFIGIEKEVIDYVSGFILNHI